MLRGQYETYSRRRNPLPSLTRWLPLVSPAVFRPPVVSASGFAAPRDEPV
ncbi:MAG: hypothetical protein QE493_01945 [Verrucomicrobiae bacterium]|nr:hypothetical protein [Verrucomicrobiae bacterium]